MSATPKDAAWEEGPCDCAECTEMPDTWCCRYCHSLSTGRTLPPTRDHVAEAAEVTGGRERG